MIKYIHVENYKSIKKLGVPFSNLNLLFGMNGMGKSSTIQSLLLCRQSFWRNGCNGIENIYPNGDLIELGTSGEIFCHNAESNEMVIRIIDDSGREGEVKCHFDSGNSFANLLECIPTECENYELSLYSKDSFVYLSAEHVGPQRKYEYSKWNLDGINKLGNRGEYTVPFLAMYGDRMTVPEELCILDSETRTDKLIDQVSAWMGKISPGVRLNTELLAGDQEARLNISYNEDWMVSSSNSPINVGFGIPYVLPIIVALLTVNKESLILIENPESHLHPKGQTAMAQLMARAASFGAQIICESHSDHIINGVRVAVKEKIVDKEKVMISYYNKDVHLNTVATTIQIDKNGNLDNYPSGLIDEWGNLMSRLI